MAADAAFDLPTMLRLVATLLEQDPLRYAEIEAVAVCGAIVIIGRDLVELADGMAPAYQKQHAAAAAGGESWKV